MYNIFVPPFEGHNIIIYTLLTIGIYAFSTAASSCALTVSISAAKEDTFERAPPLPMRGGLGLCCHRRGTAMKNENDVQELHGHRCPINSHE